VNAEAARLESMAGGDPGAPCFPALAEAWRRAGDPERAARVAREGLRRRPDLVAGRVALGLALLDLGREEEARRELESALDEVPDHVLAAVALERGAAAGRPIPAPPPDTGELEEIPELPESLAEELDEGEIERAFEVAQPETESMLDATELARSALRASDLDEPEIGGIAPGSPFATHTMADLLERQGHADDARSLRAALEAPARSEARPAAEQHRGLPQAHRERILATLERWLENVRRRA
jgi:tetratricopeptide (TPR) repeat protein